MAIFRRFLPLILAGFAASAAERWQMQYFYDQDRSNLTIVDLTFRTAKTGIAVGAIVERNEHTKPVALLTSDGGAHWAIQALKETPVSLFFLNDSLGWMVTTKGIWMTEESGRSWRKLPKSPALLNHVYFLDSNHGFAVGGRKGVFETLDGGKSWKPVAAAAEPKTNPDYTRYHLITFVNPEVGMIAGESRPPRHRDREDLPAWIQPERAEQRSEWPHLSITLDTRDGGKTWKPATASMFGTLERVQTLPNGNGLGLVRFSDAFQWPSEVFRLDLRSGGSARVYREKNRAVSDVAVTPTGTAILAATEFPGQVYLSAVPGKVKITRSRDLKTWTDMEVDYRATARRAILAVIDDANAWVATDTGMILRLAP